MSPDEAEFARELLMNSLETLKTVGLIRETHESEYTLFQFSKSNKKRSKEKVAKRPGRPKKLKLSEELENSDESEETLPEIVCISCRTALEEFKKSANIVKEECSLQINTDNNTEYTGRKWQFQMPEPIPSANEHEA
ncbi:uncharacterized protein LOC132790336 [Drosophila nasuta]|uniref:uncharacterized protein LOC132790336 n=1 Tax=Drosophila nasuta TaxID=42062 RepID=UPI00295E36FD|nr:uncharacterized protein LOC132790336 [Drosophila nasuta]